MQCQMNWQRQRVISIPSSGEGSSRPHPLSRCSVALLCTLTLMRVAWCLNLNLQSVSYLTSKVEGRYQSQDRNILRSSICSARFLSTLLGNTLTLNVLLLIVYSAGQYFSPHCMGAEETNRRELDQTILQIRSQDGPEKASDLPEVTHKISNRINTNHKVVSSQS